MRFVDKVLLSGSVYTEPATNPDGSFQWWSSQGIWRARWISHPEAVDDGEFCALYSNDFSVPSDMTLRFHVSADQDYLLKLDGELIHRGSERGTVERYYFDTLNVELAAGSHRLEALVMSYGTHAPYSKVGLEPGFLLDAEGALDGKLETCKANYRVRKLDFLGWVSPVAGYSGTMGGEVVFDYAKLQRSLAKNPEVEPRESCAISKFCANEYRHVRLLEPSGLPEMKHDLIDKLDAVFATVKPIEVFDRADNDSVWRKKAQNFLDGDTTLTVPPESFLTVVIALDDYYTCDEYLTVSGGKGAKISLGWSEGMMKSQWPPLKGNRNDIYGKRHIGFTDVFLPDGGRNQEFFLHHYRAGRYVILAVESAGEAVSIEKLTLLENRYPVEFEGAFESSDLRLNELVRPCVRTMQMCMNDTYMDCPYYEQLMYVGDARLEILTSFVMTRDRRLPDKALTFFTDSRLASGLTQSRYPSHTVQVIPPFSLIYAAAVRDYVFYTGGALTSWLLNNARSTVDAFDPWVGSDGLLSIPVNWNFVDWTDPWAEHPNRWGVPPDGRPADGPRPVNAVHNYLYVYALKQLSDAYRAVGDAAQANYYCAKAEKQAMATKKAFFNSEYGGFADTLDFKHYSEHTQCLALISGFLTADEVGSVAKFLFDTPQINKAECTIYFNFYYLEACRAACRMDKFFERMQLWFGLSDLGLTTLLESPEPSRSDCHAWSSHPLYHYFSTLLGVRPTSMGFGTVEIAPQPGSLSFIHAALPHPAGDLKAELKFAGSACRGSITLPPGVSGVFHFGATELKLQSGDNIVG